MTPRFMLATYGIAMGIACVTLALLPPSPSPLLAGCVLAFIAATAMAWPGMMTAQLLRLAGTGRIARCSSGNQVFSFAGAVLGPFLLALLLARGASYATAFICLGIVAALAGTSMLTHAASRRADRGLRSEPASTVR